MEGKHDSEEVFEIAPTDLERYYQNRVKSFEKERIDVDERLSRITETQDAVHKVKLQGHANQIGNIVLNRHAVCDRHDGTYA